MQTRSVTRKPHLTVLAAVTLLRLEPPTPNEPWCYLTSRMVSG